MAFRTNAARPATRRIAALAVLLFAMGWPAYAEPEPTPPPVQPGSSKSLEQLQAEAAAIQADFATATIGYTTALQSAQQASGAADLAARQSAAAQAVAAAERRRLGQVIAQSYQSGLPTSLGAQSMLWSLAPIAESLQEIADRQAAINVLGNNQLKRYNAAMAAQGTAAKAAAAAADKRTAADQAAAVSKQKTDDIQAKVTAAVTAMQAQLNEISAAAQVSAQLQQARNAHALARWRTYLTELTTAGVLAPRATAMRDPSKLPPSLQPIKDNTGATILGAAQVLTGGRSVRVLPSEAISAVGTAFNLLGRSYAVGAVGPDSFGCQGAAQSIWKPGQVQLPNTIRQTYTRYQAIPRSWVQYGDLIVIGDKTVGLHHIGIAIDNNEMIAADEARGAVVVMPVPDSVYGVLRPTLGQPGKAQVPPSRAAEAIRMRCGAAADSIGTGGWRWPLPDGSFQIGASFGQAGGLWASGVHTGQDFTAPLGTPVHAVAPGVAYVEHPGWAGNLVRIDHGNGLQTLYAHLSSVTVASGQPVLGGQSIGAVGNEGNSTGPHLHFEVRLGGEAVNPMPFLATGGHSFGWGGYNNGMIPLDRLCPIGVRNHALRCDAAGGFRNLSMAYQRAFGRPLCITDSYRSYTEQVQLYKVKPSLAALPGTSNHGWGMAVDLCGGVQRFGARQHQWMIANAPAYGWVHPRWARSGGSRPEPWHWEFGQATEA